MAGDLGSSDLRRAFDFAGDLAGCGSTAELDRQVRLLPSLIGTDTIIVGTVRKQTQGDAEVVTLDARDDPPGFFDDQARAAFARLWHQQPVVVHHFRGLSTKALTVSDFLSDRQWQRTEVYNDCYRTHLGLHWEIAAQIRCTPEEVSCAALQRADRDFSTRDRALLDAVTPHVRAGYGRMDAIARDRDRLELLSRGVERRNDGVLVLVDRRGRITEAGARASAILREWFGTRPGPAELPVEVEGWRSTERGSPAPARMELLRGERRLRLRLIAGQYEDVILLNERGLPLADARPLAAEAGSLARRLPITRREADVLAHIVAGELGSAIAANLGISPHTVNRHVERIYAKLGVHNRAAVTAAARDALDD